MKTHTMLAALLVASSFFFSCKGGDKQVVTSEEQQLDDIDVVEVEGRKNFAPQEALIAPEPAIMIATYDVNDVPNVMMAVWGGQCGPKHICFYLSEHKTTENLVLKRAFTVSFASSKDIAQSDYFGIVSGKQVVDKVARAGFTATKSPNVDAPIINEYPMTLECRVVSMTENALNETYVVGEIVNMSADDSILDENGKVDIMKLQPVAFISNDRSYHVIGEKVGDAWQSGRIYIDGEEK